MAPGSDLSPRESEPLKLLTLALLTLARTDLLVSEMISLVDMAAITVCPYRLNPQTSDTAKVGARRRAQSRTSANSCFHPRGPGSSAD